MDASAYMTYIERLTASAESRADVLGLVLLGSAADRSRQDEWSDHDFYWVTTDDTVEGYRENLDWLPDHESIVLAPRETEHGLKVVYTDGHVLEFAVFTLPQLALAGANAYEVRLDRGGIAPLMEALAKRPRETRNDERDLGLFISLLLIGVGRVRRGEELVGGNFIRTYAVERLLRVLAHRSPDARLDDLDPFRRVEVVFPSLGLSSALEQAPELAARSVLAIAERELGPLAGADVLRRRLGWDRE
jgi:hypothetical protein